MCWDRRAICCKFASSPQKRQPSTMTDPLFEAQLAHESDQFVRKGAEVCWIPANLAGMSSLETYPRAWRRAKDGKKGGVAKLGRNFHKSNIRHATQVDTGLQASGARPVNIHNHL